MTEEQFERAAMEAIWETDLYDPDSNAEATITGIQTYSEAGLLTNNKGIVVDLDDGSSFQLTIIDRS